MKKVLLISNYIFHYRIRIYNYFYEAFKKSGYEFSVITNAIQQCNVEPNFTLEVLKPSFFNYISYIKKTKPDIIISFLHLRNIHIYPITYYCALKKIPIVYWNHGINLKTPDHQFKNAIYRHLHNLSDAIVLYSANEKWAIRTKNQHKVFIGNNTLNLVDLNYNRDYESDFNHIRSTYKIKERNIVLFVGRITPNKQFDLLLKLFRNKDVALVIVGPEINDDQLHIIHETSNYYYLGEIYDREELSALFNASKIFTIPGNLGLALIEALFWGKPTITLKGLNTPEIIYLKNGENGFIVENEQELEDKAMLLFNQPELYRKMADNARKTFQEEAHISIMFDGFLNAVKYVQN
jgi:glycosyltransferase involved in cell wall biosynthesis